MKDFLSKTSLPLIKSPYVIRVLTIIYLLSTITKWLIIILVRTNEYVNLLMLAKAIIARSIRAMNIGKVIIPLNLRSSLQQMPGRNRI